MCGIAGILQLDNRPVNEREVRALTRALAHRGPDGEGVRCAGNVGLGHRRLSIIDLEGGAQPLCNEDGTVWVSFNGEIYNYVELQRDLEARGHVFATHCDTETIVHAYEEWGAACVERFRGMFAFAIHDERRRQLFLARDRLGVKPLVYRVEPERVAWASELGALEALENARWEIDYGALGAFLRLQYIPAPLTIYRDTYKLPPGHTLTLSLDAKRFEGDLKPQRYWDLSYAPDESRNENEWIEELHHELREAVRLRLRSDVSFGAFLSGGVDSSVVVAIMAEQMSQPVQTFSIAFPHDDFSEAPYARFVAEQCGAVHHEEMVEMDALSVLPLLMRHYGEPFGDSSAVPTYYVSRLARGHVKMVLTGDGGDESFLGYNHHKEALRRVQPFAGTGGLSAGELKLRMRRLAGDALRGVGALPKLDSPLKVWRNMVLTTNDEEWQALAAPSWRDSTAFSPLAPGLPPGVADVYAPIQSDRKDWDFFAWTSYLDTRHYLGSNILAKVDIATMANGLEARGPLLDYKVIELAAQMPSRHKLSYDDAGQSEGKRVLKRVAERYFPTEFVRRPKMGFSVPLQHWLRGAELREVEARLTESSSRLGELIAPDGVRALVREQDVSGDRCTPVWQLLCLDEWLRQHPGVSL